MRYCIYIVDRYFGIPDVLILDIENGLIQTFFYRKKDRHPTIQEHKQLINFVETANMAHPINLVAWLTDLFEHIDCKLEEIPQKPGQKDRSFLSDSNWLEKIDALLSLED